MAYVKHHEEIIYQAVLSGELEIDNLGQIWRVSKRGWDKWNHKVRLNKCNRVRAESMNGQYLTIKVMFNKKRYITGAHRLIYRHFMGKIPQGMVVNHKDGNKKNNLLSNLEIATPQQNSIHSIHVLKHGNVLNQWGENNPSAKLTNKQVLEIIDRRKQGETLKTIAQDYNVTIQTISKIVLGQRRQKKG
jgi:hypothetical protein